MSKAILEFSIPEERAEHLMAISGSNLASVIWEVDQKLRGLIKYSEDENDPLIAGLEHARKLLHEEIEEQGVSNLIFNT